MNIRKLIRECLSEAHVDASGNLVGFTAPTKRFQNGTRTNTANELLKWAKGARFTCDQKLADTNGDLRALFDMLLDIMRHQGRDLLSEFGEDEEDAFYDFAANYDKGIGYWKRMGEKIFGDMWGYGTGVDANPSVYDRFMVVSVDDDKVDEAVRRVRDFGWWCDVGESSASLEQTAIIVSPVELTKKNVVQENDGYATTMWVDSKDGREIKMTIKDVEAYLDSKDVPVTQLKTSELAPLSIHGKKKDQATLDRVKRADLSFPLIVSRAPNGRINMVLDGQHRLQKAINNAIPSVKVRVLDLKSAPQDMQWLFR